MRTNEEIMTILDRLKDEKGLTISEIARRVGMAKSAISRYFNRSRELPLNRISDFARVFGVTPEYLLGLTKPENIESPTTETTPQESKNLRIAAHIAHDLSEEEFTQMLDYVEYLKSKR